MKNKIAIIGSGAFACAIYTSLRDKEENEVSMYFKDNDCYDYVLKNRKHPKMQCNFNKDTFLTNDFIKAIEDRTTIFLCCIFSVAKDIVDEIAKNIKTIKNVNIVICCKGMLDKKPFFLCEYAEEKLENANIMVFSGGSFADEMCKKLPTYINLACKNINKAKQLTKIFDNFLDIKTTTRIKETEFFGAIKNIMAIYCGYISKNNSTNEVIGGLTNFILETKEFLKKNDLNQNAIFSQAGIGDIMLTCLSGKSRNRTFGELLSNNTEEAKQYKKKTTIEGFDAILAIHNLCKSQNIKFNIIEKMFNYIKDF